eukprot:g7571.t1
MEEENPLQANGIDKLKLEMGNDEAQELTRCRKCRILCGRESILVSMLVLVLGGLNLFIFYTYSGGFNREGLWVFFALGIFSCLLVVWFIVRTCIAIQHKKKREKKEKKPSKIAAMFDTIKTRYNHLFDVNGKYYLTKMYAAELFEHTQQVYSLTTIYLCLMPVAISTIVCSVLTVELLINIWATFHIDSQEMRDRLIFLDIFTDIFCVAFPLAYTWFSLQIPVQVTQMLLIIVYPTLSLYLKLNDIWEDYFKMDLERIEQTKKQQNSTRSRRRKSILHLSHNRDTLETQLKHFPMWLRYAFTVLNIGFVLFFVSLISVHLSTQPSTDRCSGMITNEVWEGCGVKVPFCQDLFVAKCDCAVLEMTNYTQKALPESFEGLKSLVKLGVYTGQLEELPQPLGDNHKRMVVLMVIRNKLESLPDSVGQLQNLLQLLVINNRLTSLPDSVGQLQNLLQLWVFNNRLESLPDSVGQLQNLLNLRVFNNRLTSLPDSVGQLQNLLQLWVFNNRLESLPDSVGQLQNLLNLRVFNNRLEFLPDSVGQLQNLLSFYAWNNKLTTLPKTVGDIKSLIAVDVRHNGLTQLPSSVSQWSNIEYLYVAGNPLCANLDIPSNLKGAKGLCEQQCSADCPANWLGDGFCGDNDHTYNVVQKYNVPIKVKPKPNSGCNTAACEYDKGDCPR